MLLDPTRRDDGFRRLMAMYGDRIYWHIRRIVVGHDDAEDVHQHFVCHRLSESFRQADCLDIQHRHPRIALPSAPADPTVPKH